MFPRVRAQPVQGWLAPRSRKVRPQAQSAVAELCARLVTTSQPILCGPEFFSSAFRNLG